MKRTKENWTDPQPRDRNGISGLERFDGEDTSQLDRIRQQQATQRAWIEQQKEEKERKRRQDIEAEKAFVKAQELFYRERSRQEQEFRKKSTDMNAATKEANLQLRTEKQNREERERQLKLEEERADLEEMKRIRSLE